MIMKYKIRNFFHKINIFRYISNLILCLKYPFIRWYGDPLYRGYPHKKHYSLSYTWFDEIPYGWRKAFGKQLLKEIKKAGKPFIKQGKKWNDILSWEQIKEKYGTLRLYASAIDEIQDILSKYEAMSEGYCVCCGKPARYMTKGWVEFYCEDCYVKHLKHFGLKEKEDIDKAKEKERLTIDDLPQYTRYEYEIVDTETGFDEESCSKRLDELCGSLNINSNIFYRKKENNDGTWCIEKMKTITHIINLKEEFGLDLYKLWNL